MILEPQEAKLKEFEAPLEKDYGVIVEGVITSPDEGHAFKVTAKVEFKYMAWLLLRAPFRSTSIYWPLRV